MRNGHNLTAKPPRTPVKAVGKRRRTVKALAAQGVSADAIAQVVGVSRNSLRHHHAIDLHNGREIKRAERAAEAEIDRRERERIEIVTRVWHSHWYSHELGYHLLYPDCKTLEEALAQSKKHWHW